LRGGGDRWSRDRAGGYHVNLQQFQDGHVTQFRVDFIGGLNCFTCHRSDQVALLNLMKFEKFILMRF
jgi:hypothetical protein